MHRRQQWPDDTFAGRQSRAFAGRQRSSAPQNRRRRILPIELIALVATFILAATAHAQSGSRVAVPPDLEDWRGWVLQGEEYRRCPFLSAAPATDRDSYRCAWPERLALSIDARGGEFSQRWQTFAESWITLPGNAEHWPADVRVNGAPGAVVLRGGRPALLLPAGSHAISGTLTWSTRPEAVPIDSRTAIVDLTLDGRRVAQPERPDGAVWLGKRRAAEQPERMEVQVYRLVHDEMPVRLVTLIRLQVSGDGREELLARVLPEGFTPLSLESVLPARLEADGRLRVQVRAGSWDVMLTARGAGVATDLARPVGEGIWAAEEVWSFASQDRLRVADAQGAEGIDPAQANAPPEWRGYPAFRMTRESKLSIVERSRGMANADDSRLQLQRRIWLDFDHTGLTAVDTISGSMRKDWRLQMAAPYRLESARSGGDTLLVTRNADGQGAGVELRTPELNLTTVARTQGSRGAMPATGWSSRFENVNGVLVMPPGHRLVAALGADRAPQAWIESWGLWGLFGVLVIAVFAGWLGGWPVGAVALAALLLTYQEGPGYIWLWANLLAAVALARVAPEGKFRTVVRAYRVAAFAVLGLALLPFLWNEARIAIYPQLDRPSFSMTGRAALAAAPQVRRSRATATSEDFAAVPMAPPAAAEIDASRRDGPEEEAKVASNFRYFGGLNSMQVVPRYAPGTLLQAGPGIPAWNYVQYHFQWSGPVEPDQTVRFLYIGPVTLAIWRFAGIILLVALFGALLYVGRGTPGGWRGGSLERWLPRRAAPEPPTLGAASALAAPAWTVAALLFGAIAAPEGQAAVPDSALLNELKTRLTRQPECVPSCADITAARISVRGDRLEVSLDVSALTSIAVPMPSAGDRWQLGAVTVDGRSSLAVTRENDGTLWIPLNTGAHTVRLEGSLPAAESIQLAFRTPPRRVDVSSDGWDVAGVNERRLVSGSLELTRRRSATDSTALETSSEFPAFVRVTRSIDLGLDWRVNTVVERVAPERAAISVAVPLIAGESVLSESLDVREANATRSVLVGLERGQPLLEWASGLPRSETLELSLPENAARSEVWSFVVSPEWNVEFEGFPAVMPDGALPVWRFEFHPRPGERLALRIARPARAEGSTLAIDSATQSVSFGKRSSTTDLNLNYRSTQGGRHTLDLPPTARVTAVNLDGQPVQIRPDEGKLSINLLPGSHSVGVSWTTADGAGVRTRPHAVNLNAPASNVSTSVALPQDRWPLWVSGPGVGPAVLYWSELIVFLASAWLLGRLPRSPLRTHEWLLLGLGLSTLSWSVLVLVAAWLFALRWRENWSGDVSRWRFNSVQAALALLTVIAVSALVFAGVRQSLLGSPDMGVTGGSSYGTSFDWFLDRTEGPLSTPLVISAPMWVYRALMFAWALWIALALLRWLRWAWQAWKTHGFWRGRNVAVA
jgi:hypothetical protein